MSSLVKFLALFLILFPQQLFCQVIPGNEVVVQVSKEKTVVNGKLFYLHTVKKGENMFRICKAYNVTQKDIVIANPETISGSIREGQELKIPMESGTNGTLQKIESDKFIYHVAEEGQTLFFLTQKYKISREDLIKYNPDLEFSALQVGQLVNIPKTSESAVTSPATQQAGQYLEHKVKRRETKYGISKQYNITVDELIAANPSLNSEDPKSGQILRIPEKKTTDIVSVPIVPKKDTLVPKTFSPVTPCDLYKPFSETYQVALLLPLQVDQNLTLTMVDSANATKDGYKKRTEDNDIVKRTTNIVEFYQGAFIALDSLKKAGIHVKVSIFDIDKDLVKLDHVLAKPEMAKMDLIIGPFFTEAVEKAAQFALVNKIKLVSPVSVNSSVLKNNPYVFQVNPNESVGADAMLRYIAGMNNKNIVLVCSNRPDDNELTELYRNRLKSMFQSQFKEFLYNKNMPHLNLLLAKNVDNVIIIPTNDKGFISQAFQSLNIASTKGYTVKVFGLPSGMNVQINELDYLYNLNFHFYSTFHAEFGDSNLKNFIDKYHQFYNTEPYKFGKDGYNFGMLGYDVTFYFLTSLGKLGKSFENCIGQKKIDLLHTNIIFERVAPDGGFINKGVNILRYNKDFSVTRVN
jgi:LysM repeat protein/ABC-type branched-subunit amino acid transport system substrate-binding protein